METRRFGRTGHESTVAILVLYRLAELIKIKRMWPCSRS
jgi:hypothetical protein